MALSERAYFLFYSTGVPRSGTTLLRWVFNTHSQINIPEKISQLFPLAFIINMVHSTQVSIGSAKHNAKNEREEMLSQGYL